MSRQTDRHGNEITVVRFAKAHENYFLKIKVLGKNDCKVAHTAINQAGIVRREASLWLNREDIKGIDVLICSSHVLDCSLGSA